MDHFISGLPELNFPQFSVNVRFEAQRKEIFDAFRNKYVLLNPEEWVRQHMLHYMADSLKYPRSLMGVEVSLKLNGMAKRADIVVYTASMEPWMLVECKAATVKLSQAVFDQAARYNLTMRVPFLAVTNGLSLMAAMVDTQQHHVALLKGMPAYPSKV